MEKIKVAIAAAIAAVIVMVAYAGLDIILAFMAELAEVLLFGVRVCIGTTVFAVVVFGVYWLRRQQHESLRQRDGAFALREYNEVPFLGRLVNFFRGVRSPTFLLDPNAMLGHAAVIADRVYQVEPAAGWDRQLVYNQEIERTRRVQAAVPGDNTRLLPWGNQGNGTVNAPTAKLAAGTYDKQPRISVVNPANERPMLPAPVDEQEPMPVRTWTAADALNLNTRTKLALGANDSGDLIKWNMIESPHLRVHGKSQGSGKTNLIKCLAAGAVRTGAHVIVLDRRRFKDWQAFGGKAELIDTSDPRAFAHAVATLRDVYQERDVLLGQHGAPNIAALDSPPQRIVVVVSEFGALCSDAKAEGVYGEAINNLRLILLEAASTGVHVLFEDQVVDGWELGIVANAEPVTGRMPLNYGGAGGYHHAHKLAPFTFHYQGEVFRSFDMDAELQTLLQRVPQVSQRVIDGECLVRSVRSVGGGEGGIGAVYSPVPPNERTNEQPNASVEVLEPEVPTDLQAAVWAWRDANPNGTQAELRRAFASRNIEIARSYAHEVWHKWPGIATE